MPQRIQRKRTKGWRMPEGAIVVSRPSKWGNPFRVVKIKYPRPLQDRWTVVDDNGVDYREPPRGWLDKRHAAQKAVSLFRMDIELGLAEYPPLSDLRGHDLVCWCPLEDADGNHVPCHADSLLYLANRGEA